jgi:hypothetical protein
VFAIESGLRMKIFDDDTPPVDSKFEIAFNAHFKKGELNA